jgi:hypothetical protein
MMLGLAVLAGLGLGWLLRQTRARSRRAGLALLLGLLILVEYLVIWPFPTEARPVPGYYLELARQDSAGGIVELPVVGSRRASNYAMVYQTVHQRPIAGGYIERDPAGTVELKEFLNQLLSPGPPQTVLATPDEAGRRAILADLKLSQVIAHPDLMTDQAARTTLDYLPQLLGPPIFEDQDILVYPIQSGPELPAAAAWQLLPDQESWEVVKEGAALRLKKEGYLFFYGPGGPAALSLQPDDPAALTRLAFTANGERVGLAPVELAGEAVTVNLTLRPGFNYVRLVAEPAGDVDFRQVVLDPAG